MKRERHAPKQIIAKQREAEPMLADGRRVGKGVQRLGLRDQTFNRRRNQYGGMTSGETCPLKAFEPQEALLFASGNDAGLNIWQRISSKDPGGQYRFGP